MASISKEPAGYGRYHQTRFGWVSRRDQTWRALWRHYFSNFISPEAAVIDLGAGYCNFINHVCSRQRYAIDIWPGFMTFLASGVIGHVGSLSNLTFVPDASLDCALASNVFEHLERVELLVALAQIRQKLKPEGLLFVLQPNFRFAYREYFDDYTHVGVFSDRSMSDLLAANGFRVEESIPRFLPLTIKSRLPVWAPLIWLYLKSPIKPFAGQMLLRARPDSSPLPPAEPL